MKLPRTIFAGALLTVVVAALLAQEDSPSGGGTSSTQSVGAEDQDILPDVGSADTTSGTSGAASTAEVRQFQLGITGALVSEGASDDGTGRSPDRLPASGTSSAGVEFQVQDPANRGNSPPGRMESQMQQMMQMISRSGQVPDQARQFRDVNEESVQIARRYRDLAEREPSSPKLETERQSLINAVSAAFDLRQSWQQSEVTRLQERLKRLEATIASRNRARHQIIERRVAELVNPEQVWGEGPAESDRNSTPALSQRKLPPGADARPMLPPDAVGGDDVRQNYLINRQDVVRTGQPLTGRIKTEYKASPSSDPRREEKTTLSNDLSVNRDSSSSSSGPEYGVQFLIESVDSLAKARTALAESESSLETEQFNVKRWQQFAQSDPNSVEGGQLRSAENALHRAQYQKRRAEDGLKAATRQERQARQALDTRIKLLQIDLESVKLRFDQARREEDRARSLKERNAITQSEVEEKQTASSQARLAVEKAETLLNAALQALKAADEIAPPASTTGTGLNPGLGTRLDSPVPERLDPMPGNTRLDPALGTPRLDPTPATSTEGSTTPPR